MTGLLELWLPILVASVLVFIVSSLVHMVLQWHNADYGKLDGEEDVLASMRAGGVKPGHYMFPHCGSVKEMGDPAFIEKMNQGPVGHLTVRPNGPIPMGKALGQWFVLCIVVSAIAGYVAGISFAPGADYMAIFRVTGTVAFAAYALNSVIDSIWKGISWTITAKYVVDGLLYALATAGAFGWLWPGA